MSYNGWPNYETWNIMLWMANEEPWYREYRETAARLRRKKRRLTGVVARSIVSRCMVDMTPDGVGFNNPRVRWGAIAAAMREE